MINKKIFYIGILCCIGLFFSACKSVKQSDALTIVSQHKILYEDAPKSIPCPYATDAPLMGNGSMAVAVSGRPESQVFYVCRNDFWRLKSAFDESFPALLGKVELLLPDLKGASYRLEQRLSDATTLITLHKGEQTVQCTSYVSATRDLFVIDLFLQGKGILKGTVKLTHHGEKEQVKDNRRNGEFPSEKVIGKTADGILLLSRAFTQEVDIETKAAMALRNMAGSTPSFELHPGKLIRFVCATSSLFDEKDCSFHVEKEVRSLTASSLNAVRKEHVRWWKEYWERSFVSIADSVIEKYYYISLYGMAACSRKADFPPSIFGSWITKEIPWWNGDYHLNYNHMAPYYALYGANRLEQAEPYTNSMLAQMKRGNYYSEKVCGIKDGILLPVGAGPLGIETTRRTPFMEEYKTWWIKTKNVEDEGLFLGQKSNSAYAVVNMASHFYRTWDINYAQKTYPFVKGVATFWEKYLVWENGRYVIYNDAIHEGAVGGMNPILSLGLVRMVMQTATDMSEYLGIDGDRRVLWNKIRTCLSSYPLQERNGKTVFRYTEQGMNWKDDNTLGIQHIYPAGQIGLDSNPELLKVSYNTIDEMQRWGDYNGSSSFYPAAVRIGYNPDTILVKLHQYALHTYPNGFQKGNPHGIENFSTIPNTINEMLCMGHQGVVRLFPVWPSRLDASFDKIRLEGAFLVSAQLKDGKVQPFRLLSEQGRPLVLINPWPGHRVKVNSSNGKTIYLEGERLALSTESGVLYSFEIFDKHK